MPSKATITKVKRAAYNSIRDIVFRLNGTIFGGWVRDQFICESYTDEFNRVVTDDPTEHLNKYWDSNYMPATRARLIVPDDMDVCFTCVEDIDRFIDALNGVSEFSAIYHRNVVLRESQYDAPMIHRIKEVKICMKLNAIPFVSHGTTVTIKVDVVIPVNRCLQPPFRKLDMLCNAFIMTRDHGKTLSRNTGTDIDTYSDFQRAMLTARILTDMRNFKTLLVFAQSWSSRQTKNTMNIHAMRRIKKMQDKTLPWTFINMPFITKLYKTVPEQEIESCFICEDTFIAGDKLAYTESKKGDVNIATPRMHYHCCMKHLVHQMQNAIVEGIDNRKKYIFTCPHRNTIDFFKCRNDISKYALDDM